MYKRQAFVEQGADLIILTGGMSVDPDDVTPTAIAASGANVISLSLIHIYEDLYDAIANRDGGRAEEVARNHILQSKDAFILAWEKKHGR